MMTFTTRLLPLAALACAAMPLQAQEHAHAHAHGHEHPQPAEEGAPVASAELPGPDRAQALLFDAARLNRLDLVDGLVKLGADLDATNEQGFTPLILAGYAGHGEMVSALVEAGADPCKPGDARGNTALMGVAFRGHDAIASQLIATGCDINATNAMGQTALMMAAMFGRERQIDLLLAAGADAGVVDLQGNTAASVALAQGNEAVAAMVGTPQTK